MSDVGPLEMNALLNCLLQSVYQLARCGWGYGDDYERLDALEARAFRLMNTLRKLNYEIRGMSPQ